MITDLTVTAYGTEIELVVDYDTEPAEKATKDSPGHPDSITIYHVWRKGETQNSGNDIFKDLEESEVEYLESEVSALVEVLADGEESRDAEDRAEQQGEARMARMQRGEP